MIKLEQIKQAQKNLGAVIHNTPLSYTPLLSTMLDANI